MKRVSLGFAGPLLALVAFSISCAKPVPVVVEETPVINYPRESEKAFRTSHLAAFRFSEQLPEKIIARLMPRVTPASRGTLTQLVNASFGPNHLRELIADYFEKNDPKGRLPLVNAALAAQPFKPFVEHQTNALLQSESLKKDFLAGLSLQPPPAQRTALFPRLDAATRTTDIQSVLLASIVWPELRWDKRADSLAAFWELQESLRKQVAASNDVNLQFVYRYAETGELIPYVQFWETPDGRWYAETLMNGLAVALDTATTEFLAQIHLLKRATP